MTDLQWAVIAVIHAEPGYRFLKQERQAAQALCRQGLLLDAGNDTYTVTPAGEAAFAQE